MDEVVQARRERKQLFIDAIKQDRKPKRIPIYDMAVTWKILQTNYTLTEALNSYDIMADIVSGYHQRVSADTYQDLGTINPMRVFDALGDHSYAIDDENGTLNYSDNSWMTPNDYEILITKGYRKFFFEVLMPRKYGYCNREQAVEHLTASARELIRFQAFNASINRHFINDFGVPAASRSRYEIPPEIIYWGIRGLKGVSMDMRRIPSKFLEGLEALRPYAREMLPSNAKPAGDEQVFDFRLGMLVHNLMNPKQFERFYLPYFRDFVDFIVKNDFLGLIFVQGSADHILEHLQDLPPGYFAVLLENTDLVSIKQKLVGRVALAGGLPLHLLRYGSTQECIDYAKGLIEQVGYDGSFIIAPGKMLSYKNDASLENIIAVNEYIKQLSI